MTGKKKVHTTRISTNSYTMKLEEQKGRSIFDIRRLMIQFNTQKPWDSCLWSLGAPFLPPQKTLVFRLGVTDRAEQYSGRLPMCTNKIIIKRWVSMKSFKLNLPTEQKVKLSSSWNCGNPIVPILLTQCAQIFQRARNHLTILGARRVTP